MRVQSRTARFGVAFQTDEVGACSEVLRFRRIGRCVVREWGSSSGGKVPVLEERHASAAAGVRCHGRHWRAFQMALKGLRRFILKEKEKEKEKYRSGSGT